MAHAERPDEDEGITGINVVPLVDIMLVLLVIFMITTQFVQEELKTRYPPQVEVQLPKAASAEETNPTLVSIAINVQGALFLNGKPTTLPDVEAHVKSLKADNATLEAIVSADERLTHGKVIEVIDRLRLLGFGSVAVNTNKLEIE
jgi:biopolymer transport protein ExbD